ncbi:hypothetical protein GF354_04435 [Candidatus Peregrinibacteria bacterium]|nr:hypothetical protein [Candidatus Peregrinibacteria bacterium]
MHKKTGINKPSSVDFNSNTLKTLSFVLMFTSCFNVAISEVLGAENTDNFEEYACTPDNFASKSDCMDFIVENLEISQLNAFFAARFKYVDDEAFTHTNNFVNAPISSRDEWSDLDVDEDGNLIGDCEDMALFMENFTSYRDYNSFIIALDGHVSIAWMDEQNLNFVDTTSMDGRDATHQTANLDENDAKEALSKMIEGNADAMNLGFLVDGTDVYIFPANFSLAGRYDEMEKLLTAGDYEGLKSLIGEEIEVSPENLSLRLSYLNIENLMDAAEADLKNTINDLIPLIKDNVKEKGAIDSLVKQARVLSKSGKKEAALMLISGALQYYKDGWHLASLLDAQSDYYLKSGQFEKVYSNDIKLYDIYESSSDDEYAKQENLRKFIGIRIQQSTEYAQFIVSEKSDGPFYDQADDSLYFLSEESESDF